VQQIAGARFASGSAVLDAVGVSSSSVTGCGSPSKPDAFTPKATTLRASHGRALPE
jgi:hypothetical protein